MKELELLLRARAILAERAEDPDLSGTELAAVLGRLATVSRRVTEIDEIITDAEVSPLGEMVRKWQERDARRAEGGTE